MDVSKIYQSTSVPIAFTASLAFSGRLLYTNKPFVSFQFFLSDKDDITPTDAFVGSQIDNEAKTVLSTATIADLSEDFTDGSSFTVTGTTEITIPSDVCTDARFVCLKVHVPTAADMVPPYRELDTSNDWQCVDVSAFLECTDGKCM